MRSIILILSLPSLLLAVPGASIPLGTSGEGPNDPPLPPSQDPWYTAPPNFEASPPGTVFRVRTAPGNLTTVIGNSSAAYNILYRTTDSLYQPSWAVTTLFVPKAKASLPLGAQALLSYQIAYDSSDVDFGPSYGLYYVQTLGAFGVPADSEAVDSAVGRGWFVNVPDYEGPKAAFGAAVQAGHATLDSVRAARALGSLAGFNSSNIKYAMWGYSGGAIASQMAAELQVEYANELNFSGTALGGLAPNISSVFRDINLSSFAGDIASSIAGLMNEYPAADSYVRSRLKTSGPQNATGFLAVRQMSATDAIATLSGQDIYGYFIGGQADLQVPLMQKIFNSELYMGYHGVPQMPLYSYKAIADQFSPIEETDALLQRYCGIGTSILSERNTVGGHVAEIANGEERALDWLDSVFQGTYVANGCTTRNVTVAIVDLPI